MTIKLTKVMPTGQLKFSQTTVPLITAGLIMNLDAGNSSSYSGSGPTWIDISGNGNSSSLINNPTYSSANGGSIVFNGWNQYLVSPSVVLPSGTNNFTYSIWVNFAALTSQFGNGNGAILLSGNSGGTMEFITYAGGFTSTPQGLSLARHSGGTVGSCFVDNINMPLNQWHNIVLIRDGVSSQKIYLNSSLLGTGNISNSFSSNTYAWIGAAPATATYEGYLNGRIAQVGMYNRALTQAEVTQNFNALRTRYGR